MKLFTYMWSLFPTSQKDPAFLPLICTSSLAAVGLVDCLATDSEIFLGTTWTFAVILAMGCRKICNNPRTSSLVLKSNYLITFYYLQYLMAQPRVAYLMMAGCSVGPFYHNMRVYLKLPSDYAQTRLLHDLLEESRMKNRKWTRPRITQRAIDDQLRLKEKLLREHALSDAMLMPKGSMGQMIPVVDEIITDQDPVQDNFTDLFDDYEYDGYEDEVCA